MASPMNWFRTHQKGLLIVFGVLLMISFGLTAVLNTWTQATGRGREIAKDVVQVAGKTYTDSDLAMMRVRHFQAVNFLEGLIESQQKKRTDYRQPANIMIDPIAGNTSPENIDLQLVNRLVVMQKAREFGILVSDNAVLAYLRNMADDQTLSNADFTRICHELSEGQFKFAQIREQLKLELAYAQTNAMFSVGVPGGPTSPTEAWDAFLKMQQKVECEVLAFPVSDYTAKVTDSPSASELQTIYEQGKFRLQDVAGERPGFKQPNKLAIVHLTADFTEFLDRAKLAITPEQIKKEYDELVGRKDPMILEIVPAPENQPAMNLEGDDPPPALEGEEKSGTDGTSTPPADNADQSGKDGATGEPNEENDGSGVSLNEIIRVKLPVRKPFLNVSTFIREHDSGDMHTQEEKEKQDNPPTGGEGDQAKQETPEKSENPAGESDDLAMETPAAGDAPSDQQQVTDPAAPQATDSVPPPQDPLSIPQTPVETRVKELDEKLSDMIRARLAMPAAQQQMNEAIENAEIAIGNYGSELDSYEQTKDMPADEQTPKPEPISAAEIAKQYLLRVVETPLCDFLTYSETPEGRLPVVVETMFGEQTVEAANVLFGQFEQISVWQPINLRSAFSSSGNLFFATEKVETQVLDFDEARPFIETWWKRERGLELAREAATKVASQLDAENKLLKDHDPASVRNTGLFSWRDQFGRFPVLPGDIQPGEDFMSVAFGLEMGKSGVAPDLERKNVFVIQAVRTGTVSQEELEKQFFETLATNTGFGPNVDRVYEAENLGEFQREFQKQLNDLYKVNWLAY
jgi:hypothetical protein